jgi:hypothetical protein
MAFRLWHVMLTAFSQVYRESKKKKGKKDEVHEEEGIILKRLVPLKRNFAPGQ